MVLPKRRVQKRLPAQAGGFSYHRVFWWLWMHGLGGTREGRKVGTGMYVRQGGYREGEEWYHVGTECMFWSYEKGRKGVCHE